MLDELDWLTGSESRLISPNGQKMFAPHGAARTMFFSQEPEVLLEGPAGTGKTRPILEKLHRLAQRWPGCRILIVRKTRHSMTQSVMVTFENKVLPRVNGKIIAPFHSGDQAYKYANGSVVAVAGIDNAAKILSSEWDVIYAAEATELTENDFEMLAMRLRNGVIPYQQLVADCNPGSPTHWLNRRAERVGGRMQRLLSRHSDNPTVTPAYLKILSELTGVRRLRFFEGRWAASEGLVYPEFNPATHQEYKSHIPSGWTRYRIVDFGFQHSFVCQWWAIDPDGNAHLYRELYGTQG